MLYIFEQCSVECQPRAALLTSVNYKMRNIKVMLSCLLLTAAAVAVVGKTATGPGYQLYTRRNRHTPQHIEPDVESLLRSSFFALEPIVLSIPRWRGNSSASLISTLLEREACNVFALDLTNAQSESEVVESVSSFLMLLRRQFDVPLQQQQLVGFAEGAHLAGAAAKQAQQQLDEHFLRITALDPSGEGDAVQHQLSAQDALFVEVVHTNGCGLGALLQLGDVDYYPNGGQQQPGCEHKEQPDDCAHERALELAVEMWSPGNDFISAKCAAVADMSAKNCRWSSLRMGDVGNSAEGVYFLETRSSAPFGRGAYHIGFL